MNRGPMPAYLAAISLRVASLRTWRDLQRFLAAYSDAEHSWRGHLRVREITLGPKTPREGLALQVTQYDDDLPLRLLVRLEDGQDGDIAVQQLQAVGVVW